MRKELQTEVGKGRETDRPPPERKVGELRRTGMARGRLREGLGQRGKVRTDQLGQGGDWPC